MPYLSENSRQMHKIRDTDLTTDIPKIRFRNLLYFSRLTNQFTIIFAPIWDIFGTLFEIRGKGFCSTYLSELQCVISIAWITWGKVFPDWVLPKLFLACFVSI